MAGTTERMTFFWTHHEDAPHAQCSQFYARPMKVQGVNFNCCEQWMHWRKARLFGDMVVAEAILAEPDPIKQKRLGRQVTSFSPAVWNEVARDIVFRGNIAKFSQNSDLLERLRASGGTTLVEASPYDRIWGIGLSADDPRALRRESWLGSNWLGEVLDETRVALCGH